MTTTIAATAKHLRAALKAKGWGRRHVSVRSSAGTLSDAIRVTIKDSHVPLREVEALARTYQHVDRCAITGEILGGGNTYVTASYASGTLEPLVRLISDRLADVEDDNEVAILDRLRAWRCDRTKALVVFDPQSADTHQTVCRETDRRIAAWQVARHVAGVGIAH